MTIYEFGNYVDTLNESAEYELQILSEASDKTLGQKLKSAGAAVVKFLKRALEFIINMARRAADLFMKAFRGINPNAAYFINDTKIDVAFLDGPSISAAEILKLNEKIKNDLENADKKYANIERISTSGAADILRKTADRLDANRIKDKIRVASTNKPYQKDTNNTAEEDRLEANFERQYKKWKDAYAVKDFDSEKFNKTDIAKKQVLFKKGTKVPMNRIEKSVKKWTDVGDACEKLRVTLNDSKMDYVPIYMGNIKDDITTIYNESKNYEANFKNFADNNIGSIKKYKDIEKSEREDIFGYGSKYDYDAAKAKRAAAKAKKDADKENKPELYDLGLDKRYFETKAKNESININALRAQLLIEAADLLDESECDDDNCLPAVTDEYAENEFYGKEEPEEDDEYMPEVNGADDENSDPEMEEIEDLLEDDDDAIEILTDDDGMETVDAEPTVESILRFNW